MKFKLTEMYKIWVAVNCPDFSCINWESCQSKGKLWTLCSTWSVNIVSRMIVNSKFAWTRETHWILDSQLSLHIPLKKLPGHALWFSEVHLLRLEVHAWTYSYLARWFCTVLQSFLLIFAKCLSCPVHYPPEMSQYIVIMYPSSKFDWFRDSGLLTQSMPCRRMPRCMSLSFWSPPSEMSID